MPTTKRANQLDESNMVSSQKKSRGAFSAATLIAFLSNNTILILVVLLFSLGSFFLGSVWTENRMLKKGVNTNAQATAQPAAPAAPTITADMVKGLFDQGTITFGKPGGKLTFVEFSDPSCPYCSIAAGKNPELNDQAGAQFKIKANGGTYEPPVPEMRKLVDAGQAALVWVYSPGHGNGEMGTKALYCAQEVGKFWAVHDLLMSKAGYDLLNNTVKNDKAQSGTLATFLKPAMTESDMKKCLDSGKYDAILTKDTQIATQFGINGTPGFLVNTQLFPGAFSFADMKTAIDTALGS